MLPILFGALMDLTGVRSSAFMLMYGVVWVSLIWMYWTEVRRPKSSAPARRPSPAKLSGEPTMNATTTVAGAPQHPPGGADVADWRPEDDQFWEQSGQARRLPQPLDLRAGPAVRLRRLGHVGIITVQMLNLGFPFTQAELFTLTAIAGIAGATMRIPASFLVPPVRRPQHHLPDHRDAAGPGHRHRHRAAAQGLAAVGLPADGAVVRRGRRQLRQLDVQHQHLLPEAAAGHGAGPERRSGQLRRDDHADRHSAGDDGAAARRPAARPRRCSRTAAGSSARSPPARRPGSRTPASPG